MHKKERYLRQLAKEYDVPYLYSTVNASKKSGVPASFIRKLINEGTIPAYYIGKKIMVFEDSLKTMSTLYKNYIRDKEKKPLYVYKYVPRNTTKYNDPTLSKKTSRIATNIVSRLKKGGMEDKEAVLLVSNLIQSIKKEKQ